MARMKKKEKAPEIKNAIIVEQPITETLETNYMPYAMSVIVSRAIPDIDGFKPSHRKLLYTMYKMGLLNGNKIKSADVVGQTMRLNPHGDGTIYETLVGLTRGNASLLHPFIDSKGNFGKIYSRNMAYAASRYTEVKLDGICTEVFRDIEKDTVDMVDNYSSTMKEPVLFPITFPNVLVNPKQGIAVGMASNICSFNLREVCKTAIEFIRNNNTPISKTLLAPDFSTGGQIIYNKDELEQIYSTGRGSFKLRAKYVFDEKASCIEITEIPYTTNIEAIIDKVIQLVKAGKIKEVNDIRDETDLNGLRIALDIKRGTKVDILMHKLFAMTPLEDSFGCNFNILINSKPMVLGVAGILDEWVKFRVKCIRRQVAFDIQRLNEKHHLLLGLKKVMLDIDRAISIIRNTAEDSRVLPNLMDGFGIDKIQAEYVAEIKLRNLNKEYLLNRVNELTELSNEIIRLNQVHGDDGAIHQIIVEQLKNISKKYGHPRKTEIIYEHQVPDVSEDELIANYEVGFFLTAHCYFKKIPTASLKYASEQKLKDDDYIVLETIANNKVDLVMFSDKHNAYKLKSHELDDCKASSLGDYLPNLLNMEPGERIIYVTATTDYSGYMLFFFDNGKISKINMQSYFTKNNRKKLINAYSPTGTVVRIVHTETESDDFAKQFVLIRDIDKAMLFSSSMLTPKTLKSATGTQVFTLKRNSAVSKVFDMEDFISDNIEHYRASKIPGTGHFLTEKDKQSNMLV